MNRGNSNTILIRVVSVLVVMSVVMVALMVEQSARMPLPGDSARAAATASCGAADAVAGEPAAAGYAVVNAGLLGRSPAPRAVVLASSASPVEALSVH